MFDGAMAATGAEVADQVAAEQAASVNLTGNNGNDLQSSDDLIAALSDDEPQPNEIVFIDGNVPDIDALIAEIDPNIEVVVLRTDTDGVEQIASHLVGRNDVDGIHIIAHGRPGTLDLGTAKLTEASIANKHADEIATIRAALSDNADFLIYGCNFGDQARGASAVEALALATGADVAASTDLTGAAELGGDWDLEVTAGSVETAALSAENWDHVLLVDSASNASTDPADFDIVNTGDNANINLGNGESLLIQSGTFTGNIDNFSSDATIVVAEGATFNPGNINNWSGELIVLGDATLGNANLNDGAAIQNEGTLTLNSSPSFNGDVTFINHTEGELNFPNGFGLNGAGVELTNNGTIDIEGNFQGNSGTFTNNGILDVSQTITLNSNVTALNNSVFVAVDGLTNNGSTFENNGNIVLTGTSSSLVNNSGTFTNGPDARVSGADFTNNGTVEGGGEFVFSGQTINRGPFGGTNGETINFFDSSPTGGQIFDIEDTAPNNTTNNTATPVGPTDIPSTAVANTPPKIDLDANIAPPIPGQNGFTALDFSNLSETGFDGQTEEDNNGDGEFARFSNAGVIDGQSVDVIATFARFISDSDEFAPATAQDGDNPEIDNNGVLGNVTIGNAGTGSNNDGTFELRFDVVQSGTNIQVNGSFAIAIEDLDSAPDGILGEEVAVSTANLDSFVIGDRDPVQASTGFGSDIIVLDAQGNQVFVANQDPDAFDEEGLIRFTPADGNQNNGTGSPQANTVQLNFTNTSSFTIIFHRDAQPGGFNLDGRFDMPVFDQAVVVDTNANFNNIFTEGQAPVSIVSDTITISDDLDAIDSATIVLTNAEADDLIGVTGTLPAGITATINSDSSITLSGTATADDYEQAILAITFANTSTEPNDTTIREIDITVTNSDTLTSNTATSFIQVIDVPADTDRDGITDDIDVDDDNDGILDVLESTRAINLIPNSVPVIIGNGTQDNLQLGDIAEFQNSAIINGDVFHLRLELVETRGIDDNDMVGLSDTATINLVNVDALPGDYAIFEYSLIDAVTGNVVSLQAFDFALGDVDGFINNNGGRQFEIVGFENGFDTLDFDEDVLTEVGFAGSASDPAGFTFVRQTAAEQDAEGNGGVANTLNTNDVSVTYSNVESFRVLYGVTTFSGQDTTEVDNISRNFSFETFDAVVDADSDGDGILDRLDIDSDNDGITDNIEAQTTAGFIASSGIEDDITDLNMDGLDDNFDSRTVTDTSAAATVGDGDGLTPVDTDSDGQADFVDLDSDNEGGTDTVEAALGAAPLTGTASTDSTDLDGDGLLDAFETQGGTDANDGFNVNESLSAGAASLPDTDGDASGGVPLSQDVDFRDGNSPPVAADNACLLYTSPSPRDRG